MSWWARLKRWVTRRPVPVLRCCTVRTVRYADGREIVWHAVCDSGPLDLTGAIVLMDGGHWIPER